MTKPLPLIPTVEGARVMALAIADDLTLSPLHQAAGICLVNFIERSAGPAIEAEARAATRGADSYNAAVVSIAADFIGRNMR